MLKVLNDCVSQSAGAGAEAASTATSPGILFITYTGLLEPLGQSQVLAYQERLAAERQTHIISFERPDDLKDLKRVEDVRGRARRAGIHWHPQVYHKRPSALATLWDVATGACVGIRLARKHHLRIVHARSYVASVMALLVKRFSGAKYLFDMRGFWADERVDGRLWTRDGRMYRIAKWFERRFLTNADHVVSLTHAGVEVMSGFDYLQGRMPPMTVIPTCADLQRFSPSTGSDHLGRAFTIGYVGSAGTWYLFDAAAACFSYLLTLRPEARLLVVNRNEHSYIRERLEAAGVPLDSVEIREVAHAEVPSQMARMDAGIFFIKPLFSKQASAPTKLGEMLGCGLPVLANSGVGDMAAILRRHKVGIAVDSLDGPALEEGVRALLALCAEPGIRERCVESAYRHFSLERGVQKYRAVYASMMGAA